MKTLLLAVILLAQRPAAPALQTGTVTGRLLHSDGSPATRTRVGATPIPDSPGVAADRQTLMTLTETDDSGNYRLANVPVGRYYIVAGFVDSPTYYPRGKDSTKATPVNVTANATMPNIDFQIEKSSAGLTISGKVTTVPEKPLTNVQVTLAGGANGFYSNPSTPVKPDGSFEFTRVAPGTYTLSANPAPFLQPRSIVVAEKDITGLELRIPWTTEVEGQVTVESDTLLPVPAFNILFTGGNTRQVTSSPANRTFRVTLPEGFYALTMTGIPSGFYLKSMTAGSTNLMKEPLRIDRAPLPSIAVTMGVSMPPPWVKLSGRVTGVQPKADSVVSIRGPNGAVETAIAADGSFEFTKLLPGTYSAYIRPTPVVRIFSIVLPNRDLEGVELSFPATRTISGRVAVEDGGPLPRPSLTITPESDGSPTTTVSAMPSLAQFFVSLSNTTSGFSSILIFHEQDGTFNLTVPEGQYKVTMSPPTNGSSPPYLLKSFTYGDQNLLQGALKVGASDSSEMRLTYAPASANSWVKVSGRVVGATALPESTTVSLSNPSLLSSLTATVKADGSFEFPKVYSGNYRAKLSGVIANIGVPDVDVSVANSDVTGVQIVVPGQKLVSGKILLEGRGSMPYLRIELKHSASSSYVSIQPKADGTFKVSVPEGERTLGGANGMPPGYKLKAAFYGSTDVTAAPLKVTSADTDELRLIVTAPNVPPVRVIGKVTGLDPEALRTEPISVRLWSHQFVTAHEAAIGADGLFEFAAVFGGDYYLQVWNPATYIDYARKQLTIGSSDAVGIEIAIPRQKEISGKVTLEGRGPMPRLPVYMRAESRTDDSGRLAPSLNMSPEPDGIFTVKIPEGVWRALPIDGLPPGYTVKSLTYGTTDLLTAPMVVNASDTFELRATLSTSNPTPVSVSGKVTGLDAAMLSRGAFHVGLSYSPFVESLQSSIAPDGSFEFRQMFPGSYHLRLAGPARGTPSLPFTVTNSNVTNLEIVVPAQKEIRGRVVVEDGMPIPRVSFSGSSWVPLGATSSALANTQIDVRPAADGTFKLLLPEGERYIGSFSYLAPGYTLKAATYGSTDLMTQPLKISRNDSAEMQLTFSAVSKPVAVRGRVENLDPAVAQGNVHVVLSSYLFASDLSVVVRPDGSFEFPAVFPGTYLAEVTIPESGRIPINTAMRTLMVTDKDVRELKIFMPLQKTVPGRVVVQGEGVVPHVPLTFMRVTSSGMMLSSDVTITPQGDGTFVLRMPEDEQTVVSLPLAGYEVLSLGYGSTTTRTGPLRIQPVDSSQEFVITLRRTAP